MMMLGTESQSIAEACRTLLEPGQVTELRILGSSRGVISGYFTDPDKLATAAQRWSGKASLYMTVNRVDPVLLARANNHLVEYAKQTTSDVDIERRHWLLFDFDPPRPAGVSSTDPEHEQALVRASECAAWLRSLGFHALVVADSGNGAHILVRIDLPNDPASTALVKKCTEAVALCFSDDVVIVDLAVYNAAHIWKVYGTLACKGDSTADRPHRLARILEAPETIESEPRELLEKLAALAPEEPKIEQRHNYNGHGTFDLKHWITEHSLNVNGPHSWQGGSKWIFTVCPWNPDHRNCSAYIVQLASGATSAGCHHNGCQWKDWHALRDVVEPGWRNRRKEHTNGQEEKPNPWALARPAPDFLAEAEKEFQGLAKDLVAPGAITLIASPKGIGKTQIAHALAVAMGSPSGVFRGEHVQPVRVLLLGRENPVSTVKRRLRAWGAENAPNLRVLTRQDAPELKDRKVWEAFPAELYDVLIVDSVGASTEGITEKEGKQNSEVLATLLDLAHRDIAILLLQNTEKTGTNIRGRDEWADRADIQYEVRDATGFVPSGKRPWWLELPTDGAANWAERAARRKGRSNYRLAFIPAKFRLAAEPDPFCVEISLPEHESWTLLDVTAEIEQAGEETVAKVAQQRGEKREKAAGALAEVVKERAEIDDPILKTEAEEYLHAEVRLSRDSARAVVQDNAGKLWRIEKIEGKKGRPKALYPLSQTDDPRKYDLPGNPHGTRASEAGISAGTDSMGRENTHSPEPASNGTSEDTLFSRVGKSANAEIHAKKSPPNEDYRDTTIFADKKPQDPGEDKEVFE